MRLPHLPSNHPLTTRSLIATVVLAVTASVAGLSAPAEAATTSSSTVDGTVDVVVVDRHTAAADAASGRKIVLDGAAPTLQTTTMVSTGGRTYSVPAALSNGLRPGQRVKVTLRTTRLRYATGGAASTTAAVTAVAPASTIRAAAAGTTLRAAAGAHTLTVLPVYWSSPDGQTQASLTTLAQRTAEYWSSQSQGAVAITPTVRDWVKITDPGSCDSGAIFDRALAAHHVAAPTSLTDHVLIYFPFRSDCGGWAGLGSVSGSRIWVNGYPLIDVTAHEFGHNLGLGHANRATCTSGGARVSLSSSCTVDSYQDSADVMGYATYAASGSLNTALADQIGLAQTVTASASSPAEVELAPLTRVGSLRAVKVDVGTGWVYVDFRPAQAPDTRRPEWAGVQLHYLPNGSYPQSQLLDLQPWQSAAFTSTAMPAYSVWRVPGTSVAISVGVVGSTARVRVASTASDTSAPTVPSVQVTRTSSAAATAVWTASTDAGTGLAGYRVNVDGKLAAFAGPTATSAQVSVPSTTTTVRVDAVDAAGNVATGAVIPLAGGSGSSGGAGGDTGGSQPPGAPVITAPTAGSAVATRNVAFAWSPSATGSVPVAFRLYANGTPFTGLIPAGVRTATVVLPAAATTTLGVVAVDAAGRSSSLAEAKVTVDTVAPAVPRTVKLLPGASRLTWAAPTDTGTALHYEVTIDAGPAVTTTETRSAEAPAGKHVWTVRTVDAAGNRSAAVKVSGTVDATAPGAPGMLSMTVAGQQPVISPKRAVVISWQAAEEPDTWIATYRLQISSESLAAPVVRSVSGNALQAAVSLPEGTSTVTVTAINAGGIAGEPASATMRVDTSKPSAPVITTPARQPAGAVTPVSWSAATDEQSGILRYDIAVAGKVLASVSSSTTTTTLPAGTFVAGRTARVTVRAINGAGIANAAASPAITVYAG